MCSLPSSTDLPRCWVRGQGTRSAHSLLTFRPLGAQGRVQLTLHPLHGADTGEGGLAVGCVLGLNRHPRKAAPEGGETFSLGPT